MLIKYLLIHKNEIKEQHKLIFGDLLKKQNKVQGDLYKKTNKCELICIAKLNNKPVAIGAIKEKTKSVFGIAKANLPEIENLINWELGYFYTEPNMNGQGIAKNIAKLLIDEYKGFNLMATTELEKNPAMVSILTRNGFELNGSFNSVINNNTLGLFLKF